MRAKNLLGSKGIAFDEIDISMTPGARQEMVEKTGRTSVPQIFVDGVHIGDSDGIQMLEARGELDGKLGLAG
jgi:glutaredoxin 3